MSESTDLSEVLLTLDGLSYFYRKIKGVFVKKEAGKGLSTNDLTNELKATYDAKLNEIVGADHSVEVSGKNSINVKISQKNGNRLQVITTDGEEGLYAPAAAMHKLTFGSDRAYEYDGSEDITVPVYGGDIQNDT